MRVYSPITQRRVLVRQEPVLGLDLSFPHFDLVFRSSRMPRVVLPPAIGPMGPAENSSIASKGRSVVSMGPSLKACCMASSASSLAIAAMIMP